MSNTIALALQCGADFWAQFVYTDAAGNPVNITSPKMEVRSGPNSTATVLYTSEGGTPTITFTQPAANSVLFRIPGSATKNQTAVVNGYFDAYATDPNGYVVQLGSGSFTSTPNVTAL